MGSEGRADNISTLNYALNQYLSSTLPRQTFTGHFEEDCFPILRSFKPSEMMVKRGEDISPRCSDKKNKDL